MNKQEFNKDELIRDIIEEAMFITSSHSITVAQCAPVTFNADREKIEQVMVNLLSNAAKYSSKDSPTEVSCMKEGKIITVSVRDQGPGK